MNISRKEFFRKSIFSLGEALCTVSETLRSPVDVPVTVADLQGIVPAERDDLVAAAHNDTCLARSCGCFSCMERCEPRAIKLVPGVGVRINPQLCTGCGTCEYVCPVTPKAVRLQTRTTPQAPSVHQTEIPPSKGETPC